VVEANLRRALKGARQGARPLHSVHCMKTSSFCSHFVRLLASALNVCLLLWMLNL